MTQLARRGWRLGACLVTAVLSVGFVLGCGEILARAMWPKREPHPKPALHADLARIQGLAALYKPNVHGIHAGALYRTNSHGIRGAEYSPHADAGSVRIAVTGDSVTMGWGVDEEATYAARLQEALNDSPVEGESARARYEVLNFGMAGLNTERSIERLIEKSRVYRPRVAVYGFTINDIEGPHYRPSEFDVDMNLAKRYREYRTSPSYLLRTVWPSCVAMREWVRPIPGSQLEALHYNFFENGPAWRDLDGALARFASWGEEQGVCTHVLLHTQLSQLGPFHLYHPIYDAVAEAASAHGLGVTRTFDRFEGGVASTYWNHLWDAHPNARGHQLLADALEEDVRRLPSSCWEERTLANNAP
jgi:lysophospholipase L1-like esterase